MFTPTRLELELDEINQELGDGAATAATTTTGQGEAGAGATKLAPDNDGTSTANNVNASR